MKTVSTTELKDQYAGQSDKARVRRVSYNREIKKALRTGLSISKHPQNCYRLQMLSSEAARYLNN